MSMALAESCRQREASRLKLSIPGLLYPSIGDDQLRRKTGRLVVADEAMRLKLGGEIIRRVVKVGGAFDYLDTYRGRGDWDVPLPFSPPLEIMSSP